MNKLVSIITPVFNSERFLARTLDSAISQSWKNWEMLLVDDCSTDGSLVIANNYAQRDSRIQVIHLDKNVGAGECRNVALKKSRGRYIAFLDSDDVWLPNKLEIQLLFMRSASCPLSYTAFSKIDESDKKISSVISVPAKVNYSDLLKNNQIACVTAIYDRDFLGLQTMKNVRKGQDHLLWLQILRKIPFAYGINHELALYRIRNISNSSNKLFALKQQWTNYRKFEKLSFLSTTYYITLYILHGIRKNHNLSRIYPQGGQDNRDIS